MKIKCLKCNSEMKCTDDSGSFTTNDKSWEHFNCQNKDCNAELDIMINETKITYEWDLKNPVKIFSRFLLKGEILNR